MEDKVDEIAKRKGTYVIIEKAFRKLTDYNQKYIDMANKTGYVETMPDLEVCPDRGYPLQCTHTQWGRISPTVPLSYHVQGTATYVIFKAMLRVQAYLDKINVGKKEEDKWFLTLQVHDELVVDLPFNKGLTRTVKTHLRNIAREMETCGDCIDVPLTTGCEIHENNWSEGYEVKFND